ncbi:unnamed protein product [Rhizoctonia solani]|uniref:Uncharacterized protein n=1 Tax=Rhizoctonia solani TaxID=456999 RepID=A0A8H3H5J9_9AGAM|nr:unnamed protein product [Rhizoctonia solani]
MSPIANLDYIPIFKTRVQTLNPLTNDPELTTRGLHDTSISHTTSFLSGSRFAGRRAGGATRDHIYGESYYGSGYPYGSYGSTWVGGRPFPFYYWPIYVGPYEYYGASEYGPPNSTDRPGGPMYTMSIFTFDPKYNTSDIYHLLGDKESVNAVLFTLRKECSVVGGSAVDYDPVSNKSSHKVPPVESIIQYYRASSFALSLDEYNNSAAAVTPAALANNTGQLTTSLPPPTPLPSSINPMLLDCINRTVGTALPLLGPELSNFPGLGGSSDSASAMIACMHLVLLVALVSGLVKGVTSWLSTVRREQGALLDRVADLVSMVSAFSW